MNNPKPDHNAVFSDIMKHGMADGKMHIAVQTLEDDEGNPVISGDFGPVEIAVYASPDNAIVVQIDCESLMTSPQRELRVYLNDSTIFPELDNTNSIHIEGAQSGS